MKTVTLRDANQGFARYVRAVEAGEEFVITRNGVPVARLAPVDGQRVLTPEQQAAWERIDDLFDALAARATAADPTKPNVREPFDRAALHER